MFKQDDTNKKTDTQTTVRNNVNILSRKSFHDPVDISKREIVFIKYISKFLFSKNNIIVIIVIIKYVCMYFLVDTIFNNE